MIVNIRLGHICPISLVGTEPNDENIKNVIMAGKRIPDIYDAIYLHDVRRYIIESLLNWIIYNSIENNNVFIS